MDMKKKTNIVLIGMPAAGKSTIGVLLAKKLGLSFMDTDLVIQAREKKLLSEIIAQRGIDHFLELEEHCLCSLGVTDSVIATGGSAVYSGRAMAALGKNGVIVYLETELDALEKRLSSLDSRGVIRSRGQSIADLFHERIPLYQKYADATVPCGSMTPDQVLSALMNIKQIAKG